MKEISLKESTVHKLKEYPLLDILSTEGKIYYYKKDKDWNSILFKKLYVTDEKRIKRKIDTIAHLQDSELSTYKELVIPEKVVSVGGEKCGFTIKEVTDCINLGLFLKSKDVLDEDKLLVLKKIGELLHRVQAQDQEFYFGDLQEYNFLVDKNKDIFVVDLDSSAVNRKKPLETKYIIIDKKTHGIPKYKVNSAKRCYPNSDIDIFCYNSMILNYLAGTKLNRLDYNEYYDYLTYLEDCSISKEMIEVFSNHYTNKENESVVPYLDELKPDDYLKTDYKVYKYLKK